MKSIKRATAYGLAIIAIFTLFFAILAVLGKRTGEQIDTSPAATIKLKIGFIPILDCSQIYVASQRGYFAENGLDVELVPLAGGPTIIQSLAANSIDVGFANITSVVFYEESSSRLNHLAGGTRMDKKHSEAGLVVTVNSGIERITDLKGKTIAVNSRRNIVDLAVLRAAKTSGLAATDITLVELPFKDMETALRANRIDAATLPEPILTSAMKTPGLRNLGDHFVIAFGEVYSTGYFSMPASSKVTAEVRKKFEAAISKATSDLENPTEETYRAISSITKFPVDVLKTTGKPAFVVNVPRAAFDQMRDWMEEEGFLFKRSGS